MLKTMTVRAAIAAILVGLSMSAHAIADPKRIDIPAGDLRQALLKVSETFGADIVFSPGQVEGFKTQGAQGELTTEQAINKLLEGTPLQLRMDPSGAILIAPPVTNETHQSSPSASGKGATTEGTRGKGSWNRLRIAQAEPSSFDQQKASQGATRNPEIEQIDEIVVTGTHIRGTGNRTSPITTISREQIDQTGYGTTSALIESLPQNFASASQSGILVPGVQNSGEQGASINLRGIGEGTTLTLVNGRRLAPGFNGAAADISAIPLSAVERVEVLTDGASALYGSDAVGGVVNFILRRDYDGAETRARLGYANGVNETRVGQTIGTSWSTGNVLLSGELYRRGLLSANEREFVPRGTGAGSLLPRDNNYSLLLSGNQQIASSLRLVTDVLLTDRTSLNDSGPIAFNADNRTQNPQLTSSVGAELQIGPRWLLEASGSYASNKLTILQETDDPLSAGDTRFNPNFRIVASRVKADGPLATLAGGDLKLALGADHREEKFSSSATSISSGARIFSMSESQSVTSAFAELYIPIFTPQNAVRNLHSLEVSLAGRYDYYSSFGGSFDPKIGLTWQPVSSLLLRASYGTSYKAPNLSDYDLGTNIGAAFTGVDPASPIGTSYQIVLFGTDPQSFKAQESSSLSAGLEFRPQSIHRLKMSINYYSIRFEDRIENPPDQNIILGAPGSYADLFIRNPTPSEVTQAISVAQLGQGFLACNDLGCELNPASFDPSSVEVIVDDRRRNLSSLLTSGIDFSLTYGFDVLGGVLNASVDATHILFISQKLTPQSESFDTDDTFYNPANWRARAALNWQGHSLSLSGFANFTDSYVDNRLPIPRSVKSYTTLDARAAYEFPRKSGWLGGLAIALSVQNLLDTSPPRVQSFDPLFDLGFDPTNSSPLGRLVAIEFVKQW